MSSLAAASTPVTFAPYALASCTANVPTAPPAPLIKTSCPGSHPSLVPNALNPERSGRGDGRGLFERQAGGFAFEPRLRNGRDLGEGATVAPQVGDEALTEDLITRPESRHVLADRLDDPRQVRARNEVLGRAEPGPHDPEDIGHAAHDVPHVGVDRGCTDPDEHLIVPGGRLVDLAELQDVSVSVPILNDRLHLGSPSVR